MTHSAVQIVSQTRSNQIRLLGCFYLLCNKQHIEALYVSPAHCQGSGYYIYVSETSQTTWCTAEADEEDEGERLVWLVCLFISSVTLRVTEVCGKFLPEVGLRQTQNLDLIQMWILGLLKDCLLWYWTKLNFLPHFLGMHPCNSFW